MGFFQAVGTCFRKYFTISGRASRAEYWWWVLFTAAGSVLVSVGLTVLEPQMDAVAPGDVAVGQWDLAGINMLALGSLLIGGLLFYLLIIIPTFTVTVRRLHDTGRTGFWALLPYLMQGGMVYMAVATATGSGEAEMGAALVGGVVMLAIGVASIVLAILLLIWTLQAGTRGDNYFGPDPYGDLSYEDLYSGAASPSKPAAARRSTEGEVDLLAPSAGAMSHKEEVHALYQQRVLHGQARDAAPDQVLRYH